MFRFENIEYLWFLTGVIPLILLIVFAWQWHQRLRKKIGEEVLIDTLTEDDTPRLRKWQQGIIVLIFLLLIIAWSNPQWGGKRQKVKARSSDIFVALDISNSMYCEDVAPSRMDQAKRFATQLTERLRGERLGLILFAGNAYLQMPLTSDYAAAQVFIQSASPSLAGTQGTALSEAIKTAEEGFTRDDNYHRVLVIISDGEDHDSEALTLAREAHDKGMIIFTVGVGTTEGSFIPMMVRGNQDWKRDGQGQPVRTQLNETLLTKLAEVGGGSYFFLNGGETILQAIDQKVDTLEKREFEERSFTEYESYFQVFLGLAILGILFIWSVDQNLWKEKKLGGS